MATADVCRGVLLTLLLWASGEGIGSKEWRRNRRSRLTPRTPAPAPPSSHGACNFSGSWTDGSSQHPVCEATSWGCHQAGAQFWLTDTGDGFRGVSHGPADFVHAGNGPYQMGWSHANATYTDQAACASRGPPSCANVGGRDCAPPSGADTTWKLRPNTRVENFPSVRDWTGVPSVAACEAKCAATHGCELWTWVDTSPGWSGRGGCWAFPRSAQLAFTTEANWTSGIAVSNITQADCQQLGCCWHAEGVGPTKDLTCVQPEAKACEVCVTLDADAPGRTLSTSCSSPPPGSFTNSSDWSEHTCASCGEVAADCSTIEWASGPLSRNATTKTWTREQQIHTIHLVFSTHFDGEPKPTKPEPEPEPKPELTSSCFRRAQ